MWTDVCFALRAFRRSPGFAALSVLTLALGIGASTSIFSLLYQVVLRSIPVHDPASLVTIESDFFQQGWQRRDNSHTVFSYPMYRELRDRNQVFVGLAGRSYFGATLTMQGNVTRVNAEVVTGNYFQVLGLEPAVGRLLVPSDDQRTATNNAIVLSYAYWAGHLGSDPNVLNRQILVNNHPVAIVGVAPRNFRGLVSGNDVDFFAPVSMLPLIFDQWQRIDRPDSAWLNLCGRLKPGVSSRRAAAALLPLYRSVMADQLPSFEKISESSRKKMMSRPIIVQPASQGLNELRTQWQKPLLVLMFMVGLVLLIACANVANLLVARSVSRQKETAVRLAIGARRFQIVRQLLIESIMLALAGGLLGLFAAKSLIDGLLAVVPADATGGWLSDQIDPRVLLFSLVVSVATGLLFGLLPALQITKSDLASVLKAQSLSLSSTGSQSRARQFLVAAQICLSFLLLIGAGLFTRSLMNLLNFNPGFQPEHLITFSLDPSSDGYAPLRAAASFRELNEKLRLLPGVVSTAVSEFSPFSGYNWGTGVTPLDSHNRSEQSISVSENSVNPAYFQTLGIPLLSGRVFTETDTHTSAKVAIVNETLARYLWGSSNAVGRHLKMGPKDIQIEIVGVVGDSKFGSLREKPDRFVYVPKEQADDEFLGHASFFLRTRGNDQAVMNSVRPVVKQVFSNVPVDSLNLLKTMIDNSVYTDRLIAVLAIAFGILAMALAAIGLYGTISYAVTQRTREFGIRLALGAARKTIAGLVFREIGILIGLGIAVGLPVSYTLARFVESQLFGIRAHDPWILLGAVLFISIAAALAGFFPALRAMHVEPVQALRYE
jgi:predicted permease